MDIDDKKPIKIEVLCRYFNGFDKSCKYLDKCKYKHSFQISEKPYCRNWIDTKSCEYGQNCNYFHPLKDPYVVIVQEEEENELRPIQNLENPLVGKKLSNNQTKSHTTSEYLFKIQL